MTQTLTSFDSLVQCATLDYLHQSRRKRVWRLVLLHLSSHYPASAQWNNKPLTISGGSVCGSGGTYDHCATSQCTRLFCLSRKIQLQTNQKWDNSCNMRPVLCRFLICCDADSNIRQHVLWAHTNRREFPLPPTQSQHHIFPSRTAASDLRNVHANHSASKQ